MPDGALMSDGSLLTSHRVGRLLQVNPSSINKWIEDGKLPAFRTPGGHRRIRAGDVVRFLEQYEMPIPAELVTAGRRRLLWVDDDTRLLASVRRSMKRYSDVLDARFVSSGITALVTVGAFRPHAVVLDVIMPEVDGIEVCRRLKTARDTADIAVVFVSAQDDDRVRERARDAGAAAYFNKPFRLDDIVEAFGVRRSAVAVAAAG